MAKYGSGSITITYDDAPGGTPRAITSFVLTMGAVKITADQAQSDAFGDVWDAFTPTGHKKMDPIELTGYWDDTATTGPHAVLGDPDDGPSDSTRTLVIVYGGGKTITVETRLASYAVLGKNRDLTEFAAVIQPSGAAAWS